MQDGFADANWALRLVETSDVSEIAGALGEEALVRRLHGLLREAPKAVSAALGPPCEVLRVEELLARAAPREAAFHLLGRACYMISKGQAGTIKATILLPGIIPETTGEGPTEAIAICGALTDGLLAWTQRSQMARARQEGMH